MKPLELTVFPRAHADLDGYVTPDRGTFWYTFVVDEIRTSKRLTNAEMAAETWRANLDLEFVVTHPDDAGTWDFTTMNEDVRRELILRRFATLPHYDEESNGKSD